jgi:hypothetical protein
LRADALPVMRERALAAPGSSEGRSVRSNVLEHGGSLHAHVLRVALPRGFHLDRSPGPAHVAAHRRGRGSRATRLPASWRHDFWGPALRQALGIRGPWAMSPSSDRPRSLIGVVVVAGGEGVAWAPRNPIPLAPMLKRTRFFGGVLAGTAFLLSFAWGVQASICAAEFELPDAAGAAAEAADTSQHVMGHGSMDGPDPGHDCGESAEKNGGAPFCPSVLTGSSCQTASSAPAVTSAIFSSTGKVQQTHLAESEPPLLLPHRLFRPPRA